jgi:hypothetical protein
MGAAERAPRWRRVRDIAGRRYRRSVFRRTAVLLMLLVPAYGANLAVMYFAADLFSAGQFGLFYVANAAGNVLFSGSLILNMVFTRHLVAVLRSAGRGAAFGRMRQIERLVLGWGALAAAAICLAMLGVARQIGVHSDLIVLFIVLDAYTAYLGELGRVMLQALHRTLLLGLYTLVWMVLRFALCIAGILAFGTVWAALGGIAASALAVYGGFRLWVGHNAAAVEPEIAPLPSLRGAIPAVLGYGLSIVVTNLDVLLGYLLLGQAALGVYSASSLFPKAMLVAMTPLLQMLFPMMVGGELSRAEMAVFLGKIGVAMLALSAAGAAIVWQLSPLVCGGAWGMPLCDRRLLDILLLSVAPLVLLRLLVLLGYARGRDWLTAWLALPAFAYVWIAVAAAPGSVLMAEQFAAFSAAAFAFLFVAHAVVTRSRVFQPG